MQHRIQFGALKRLRSAILISVVIVVASAVGFYWIAFRYDTLMSTSSVLHTLLITAYGILVLIYLPYQEEIDPRSAQAAASGAELELDDLDTELPFFAVERVAAGLQIPVVDTRRRLVESMELGRPVHWKLDRHYTREGHRAIMQSILDWLGQRPEADRIAAADAAGCGADAL